MSRKGLLAAGNWIIDRVKVIDHWPDQESLSLVETEEQNGNGSPYNILMGLSKFRAPFPLHALGLLGHDSRGESLIHECQKNGIHTPFLRTVPFAATSYTDVMMVGSSKRRTLFHHHGANALLAPHHFDPRQTSCRIFHLGYLMLLNGLDAADSEYGTLAAKVLASYRSAGYKTSIDMWSESSDRFSKSVLPAIKHTDFCIFSENEASTLTGEIMREEDTIRPKKVKKAAQKFLELGARELVVIHFSEGAYGLMRNGEEHLQGSLEIPPDSIKSFIGSGDAFCAGMLYGLHEDWPLDKCLNLALCSYAACLSHPSSTGGLLSLQSTQELEKRYGYRKI
jgi:sugar/nucleoside kinase (ribokinase family)